MKNLLSEPDQNCIANPALDDESFLTHGMIRRNDTSGGYFRSQFSGNDLVKIWRDGSCEQRRTSVRRLLERFEPAAFLVCNILLEKPEDAALACENACVEAIGKMELENLEDLSAFRVVLFRSVHRHCANFALLSTPDSNADYRIERTTLVGLAGDDRWMLAMRFFADLDREEIAAVMQVSDADVRATLWSGMQTVIRSGFYTGSHQSDTAA